MPFIGADTWADWERQLAEEAEKQRQEDEARQLKEEQAARDAAQQAADDALRQQMDEQLQTSAQNERMAADFLTPPPVHSGGNYETALPPDQEAQFQQWRQQYAPQDSGYDYDLRGAFLAGVTPDPETGHWPDTFKKPNHPTFSDQSQYATGDNAERAGHWQGDTFVPPAAMTSQAYAAAMAGQGLPPAGMPGYDDYGNLSQQYNGFSFPVMAQSGGLRGFTLGNDTEGNDLSTQYPAPVVEPPPEPVQEPVEPEPAPDPLRGFTLGNDTMGAPIVPAPPRISPAIPPGPPPVPSLPLPPPPEPEPLPPPEPTRAPGPTIGPITGDSAAVPTDPMAPTQDPNKVLLWARERVGLPYSGPLSRIGGGRFGEPGYDCSSFVSSAFSQIGVRLTPFTDAAADQTTLVSNADARPGDIVFYRYNDSSQNGVRYPHMGIYLGNGQMIDAGYSTGVTVRPLLNLPYEIRRAPGVNSSAVVNAAATQAQVADRELQGSVAPADGRKEGAPTPPDTSYGDMEALPTQDVVDQAELERENAIVEDDLATRTPDLPTDTRGFRLGADTSGNQITSARPEALPTTSTGVRPTRATGPIAGYPVPSQAGDVAHAVGNVLEAGAGIPRAAMGEQVIADETRAAYQDLIRAQNQYGSDDPRTIAAEDVYNAQTGVSRGADTGFGAAARAPEERGVSAIATGIPYLAMGGVGPQLASMAGGAIAPYVAEHLGADPEQQSLAGAAASMAPFAPGMVRGVLEHGGQLADAAQSAYRTVTAKLADMSTPASDIPHLTQQLQGLRAIMDEGAPRIGSALGLTDTEGGLVRQVGGGDLPNIFHPGEPGPARSITDLTLPDSMASTSRVRADIYGPTGDVVSRVDFLAPEEANAYLAQLPDDVQRRLPNLERITQTPENLATMIKIVEDHGPEYDDLLQTMKLDDVAERARALGMTPDDFVNSPLRSFSPEELTAYRMATRQAIDDATNLPGASYSALSAEEKANAKAVLERAADLQMGERRALRTAGQTLRSAAITVGDDLPYYNTAITSAKSQVERAGQNAQHAEDLLAEVQAARQEGRPVDLGKALPGSEIDTGKLASDAVARVARSQNAEQQARAEARKLITSVEKDWSRRLDAVDPISRTNLQKDMARESVEAERAITDALLGKGIKPGEEAKAANQSVADAISSMDQDWEDRLNGVIRSSSGKPIKTNYGFRDTGLNEGGLNAIPAPKPNPPRNLTMKDANSGLAAEWDRYEAVARYEARRAAKQQAAAEAELQRNYARSVAVGETKNDKDKRVLEAVAQRPVSDEVLQEWYRIKDSDDPIQAEKFLRGVQPFSAWNAIKLLGYQAKMAAVSTHTNQLLTNLANLGFDAATKTVAGGIDAGLSRVYGSGYQRTRFAGEGQQMLEGAMAGQKLGWQNIHNILETGISPRDIVTDQPMRGLGSKLGPLSPAVDAAVEGPLRFMAAGDEFVRSMADMGAMRAVALRQAGEEGLTGKGAASRAQEILNTWTDYPDLGKKALDMSSRVVFQEERKGVDGMVNLIHWKPFGGDFDPLVLVAPFVRTPANIVTQGVEASPIGAALTTTYGIQAARLFAKAERTPDEAERLALLTKALSRRGESIDAAARTLIGTGVTASAGALYQAGVLTGWQPAKPGTEPPGWQPWSVHIGDNYFSVVNLPPVAIAAVLGAIDNQGAKANGDLDTRMVTAAARFFMNQTWLQNFADFYDAVTSTNDPAGKKFSKWAATFAGGFVPYSNLWKSTFAKIAEIPPTDPHGVLQGLEAAVPFLMQNVPPRLDVVGRPDMTNTGAAAAFSPARMTHEADTAGLHLLREHGGAAAALPQSINGQALTPEQRQAYGATLDASTERYLRNLRGSDLYQGMREPEQAEAERAVLSMARSDAHTTVGITHQREPGEPPLHVRKATGEPLEDPKGEALVSGLLAKQRAGIPLTATETNTLNSYAPNPAHTNWAGQRRQNNRAARQLVGAGGR